jgi:T3SS (YopN, CesT) and YbjN peptide-binding chaperone 1
MVVAKTDVNTVRARVQGMLTQLVGSVSIDRDGNFFFQQGSTQVFVRMLDKEDFVVADVFAPVLWDVPVTPELYKYVAEATNSWLFGHLMMFMNEDGNANLFFKHDLLADYIDSEELDATVACVALNADELDDELKGRFGGKRQIEG